MMSRIDKNGVTGHYWRRQPYVKVDLTVRLLAADGVSGLTGGACRIPYLLPSLTGLDPSAGLAAGSQLLGSPAVSRPEPAGRVAPPAGMARQGAGCRAARGPEMRYSESMRFAWLLLT
jgi:hypothetical protein